MARAKKEAVLTPEERLQAALVPDWEWPYKLPENWCWTRLGSVSTIVGGGTPSSGVAEYYENGTIPWISPADLSGYSDMYISHGAKNITELGLENSSARLMPAGTVCLSSRAPIGYVVIAQNDISTNQGFKSMLPSPCFISEYLYWYLKGNKELLESYASGTTFLEISGRKTAQVEFPLAPLAEQQRIVDRIESLFAKLDEAKETAQAVVDSFETCKAAILHKAFTGELTAKWREEHGVRMESWEHHQFSDLCAIVRGGSPRPAGDPRYYDGNIPFMKVADITRNDSPYVSKVEYSIKEEGLKKTRMVEANTLLLTNSGATLGVPAITTIRTTFNDGIAAFIGIDIDSLLFYYYFWTSKTAFLRSINMGAAQPNLNTKLIGEVEIDVPQTAERVEIARVLNALLSKEQQAKEAAEAVLDQIDLMKKSILARAFRGELGTNDPSEESAVELLRQVIAQEDGAATRPKEKAKRVVIPTEIKSLLSGANEEAIVKLLLKAAPQSVPAQTVMSISKKKFVLMDALRNLEKKQIVSKSDSGEYSLVR